MTVEPKARLRSLDVMRGATIAGMLLVNNAGDLGHTFAPLLHAEWNGWTPTDLVFPFFLFVLGVAIPLAFASRLEKSGGDLGPLYRQIVRRTIILFALGLFLTWFPFMGIDWSRVRIPGVLQRIALVYFFASLAYLHLNTRGRAWLTGGLLLGYWLAMTLVPVPGFGAGDLSPEGNLAGFVDRLILGAHVWRYAPGPADPEGILSTLPAIATALAGIFTGEWLRTKKSQSEKLIGLFVAGSVAAVAGAVFGWFFPINKNLWTSSYVVLTAGLGFAHSRRDPLFRGCSGPGWVGETISDFRHQFHRGLRLERPLREDLAQDPVDGRRRLEYLTQLMAVSALLCLVDTGILRITGLGFGPRSGDSRGHLAAVPQEDFCQDLRLGTVDLGWVNSWRGHYEKLVGEFSVDRRRNRSRPLLRLRRLPMSASGSRHRSSMWSRPATRVSFR